MLKSYLKIAWRTLLKDRQFTCLNLAGLSTGLACALLIWLWVYDELTFDRFHENDSRLYQVMEHRPNEGGIATTQETPALLAEALAQNMPEVEYAAAVTPPSWFMKVPLTVNDKMVKAAGLFAGKDYFNIFSWGLMAGNKNQVLADKNNVVISAQLAKALFHTTNNIIGKTITWQIDSVKKHSIITGIFKGTPANSSVQFDFVISFAAFKEMMGITGSLDSRNSLGPFFTYLVLKQGAGVKQFNTKLAGFMKSHSNGATRNMFLKPYGENYLYGSYENGVQSGGRITYVKLFSLIAVFIILIACINFMNLSTARAFGRMKEVGMRKTLGAPRGTLILQHLGESMLMAFAALALALLLVALLLPAFNEITGKHLTAPVNADIILWFLGITLFTGLLAGSYPALYLSGFNAITVLKGNMHHAAGATWARKGLVVFQFTVSVIFIAAVLVIYQQITYVQTKSPGYDKDHVIYFEAEGKVPENTGAFLAAVKQIPGVINAAGMVGNVQGNGPGLGIAWKGEKGQEPDNVIMYRPFLVSCDLIETLGIKMTAGRTFSRDFSADRSAIIFNEAAIKAMGIENPVGKVIKFGGTDREIIGVAGNFNFQSLHKKVGPLFFQLEPRGTTIAVKIKAGMEKQAIDKLSAFYKGYNPGFAFDYKFLDEDYQAQYIAEKRVAALSKYFAGLAVLISCLGLFGLAAFTAEKKRKEIGIRKVLGASVQNVAVLFSLDLIKLVVISIIIATPIAWLLMDSWLQSFAYRVNIHWWTFALTGLLAMAIALLTVGFQSIKIALLNPVKSLRLE
jgi:ABC-type antimicrobial peptide transport system permease subunit